MMLISDVRHRLIWHIEAMPTVSDVRQDDALFVTGYIEDTGRDVPGIYTPAADVCKTSIQVSSSPKIGVSSG